MPLQTFVFLETNDRKHVHKYRIQSRSHLGCNIMDLLFYCPCLLLYASIRRHLYSSLYKTRHVHCFLHLRKYLSSFSRSCFAVVLSHRQPQLAVIAAQICTTLSVHHGMGQHIGDLGPPQIVLTLKWVWFAQILQLFANTTGKIAVITYLATIHGPSHHRSKLAFLWSLGSLQVASIVILIALILAQCSPLQKLWNEAFPGTCNGRVRNQNFGFFQGSEWCIDRVRGEKQC